MSDQQLVARIKRSCKYWGQTPANQWFDVRVVEDTHYQLRGNNNNYRFVDVVMGMRLTNGNVVDFSTGKMAKPKTSRESASDLLKPTGNRGIVSADICYSALMLVGDADVTEADVQCWTGEQLDRAYDWAMRVHLCASDNDDVFVPMRPDYIPAFVREPFIAPDLEG